MKGRDLEPAELIRLYGGRARKRFGQNFLVNRSSLERIVDLAQLSEGERVVEVGPGPGALTSTILRRDVPLTAIEIDRDLAEHLRETFGDDPCFTLIEGDARKVDFGELFEGEAVKVIANLPYNVATPLLLQMIDQKTPPERLVLMFQKEVADRICAPVGSRASGWLTVAISARFIARIGLRLPPGAFVPPPKIDSAVIVLTQRETPLCSLEDEAALRAIAELGFGQRRKTLRNNLKGVLSAEEIEAAGVDPQHRAEVLSMEEWLLLVRALDAETRQQMLEDSRSGDRVIK